MKIGILFLSWVLVFCASGSLAEAYDGGLLSVGGFRACAIDEVGVKCSGGMGQSGIPVLKNPTSISVGRNHKCTIDNEGVKCWGFNEDGQTNVPLLKNTRSISVGGHHTCAIDDNGVKCWGANLYGQANVPSLKNPVSVSAGNEFTCVIDDEGVKCWGRGYYRPSDVPQLKRPFAISAGYSHACAIDAQRVHCWGGSDYGPIIAPSLQLPFAISAGRGLTCAIDSEGLKCWGPAGPSVLMDVPPLQHPFAVSTGDGLTCAIDINGIMCWGRSSDSVIDNGQAMIPQFMGMSLPSGSFFELTRLGAVLDFLAFGSMPTRTFFFNSLKYFVNKLDSIENVFFHEETDHGRYALFALLEMAIEGGDSTYSVEKIIPAYKTSLKRISQKLDIHGFDQVKDFPLTRLTVLKIMQVSLSTMTEFLIAEDKAHVQDIIKLIGLAMSDISSAQNITNVLTAINANEAIIDKLNHSSKTQFLVLTLQTAQQWLKAKIQ